MSNNGTMPKPERERQILQFLAKRNVMLPPKVLFENMKEYEGITFSYRTVLRHLNELQERGFVEQIEGERSYYRVTPEGREYLAESGN